ncbi:Maltodextrin glucosidase [Cronobacter malonaticus 507]|nr:Maltodextrin glucosidase [Cronobacter malonaticus 507]
MSAAPHPQVSAWQASIPLATALSFYGAIASNGSARWG